MCDKIYAIVCDWSDIDISSREYITYRTTREEAEEFLRQINEFTEHIKSLAIKDRYDIYACDDSDYDYEYRKLYDEACFAKAKELIPRICEYPEVKCYNDIFDSGIFTDEEEEIADDIDVNIQEYMEKSGKYTQDVIDATVKYNRLYESVSVDREYGIEEISMIDFDTFVKNI